MCNSTVSAALACENIRFSSLFAAGDVAAILYQLMKILGGATHNVSTVTDNTYTVRKITQSAKGTVLTRRGVTLFRFTTINLWFREWCFNITANLWTLHHESRKDYLKKQLQDWTISHYAMPNLIKPEFSKGRSYLARYMKSTFSSIFLLFFIFAM